MRSMEIQCSGCGEVTLARLEPVYDGFKKTGESFICTGCGKLYETESATPFIEKRGAPAVFNDDDRPDPISVFDDDERRKSCGWCRHFVVNPFTQRCGLTNKAVEATDLCLRFDPKEDS